MPGVEDERERRPPEANTNEWRATQVRSILPTRARGWENERKQDKTKKSLPQLPWQLHFHHVVFDPIPITVHVHPHPLPMVERLPLCLCAIVKDEAENLQGGLAVYLARILPHVQSAVIVDTGSTDGTLEILVDAATRTPWLHVFQHAFNGKRAFFQFWFVGFFFHPV